MRLKLQHDGIRIMCIIEAFILHSLNKNPFIFLFSTLLLQLTQVCLHVSVLLCIIWGYFLIRVLTHKYFTKSNITLVFYLYVAWWCIFFFFTYYTLILLLLLFKIKVLGWIWSFSEWKTFSQDFCLRISFVNLLLKPVALTFRFGVIVNHNLV